MTSQFKLIIEKIKTDKNVQVAVASIAAATVLVIGGTSYYLSRSEAQNQSKDPRQTYRRVASIRSNRYEKTRKVDSDLKIDDKLVELLNSALSSSDTSRDKTSAISAKSSEIRNNLDSSQSTRSSQSDDSSVAQTVASESRHDSSIQLVGSAASAESNKPTESIEASESIDSSKSIESTESRAKKENEAKDKLKSRIFKTRSGKKKSRSDDQIDLNDGQKRIERTEKVSSDSWNDEDVVEDINLARR